MVGALLAAVQATPEGDPTPTPGVGPDELVDFGPPLARLGWFLAGTLVVIVVGWYVLGPLLSRVVRRRNRDNPTLQEAVMRYFRLVVLLLGLFVGAGVAGYGQVLTSSAIVVAAATLAVGVAGQTVIGSLVSGIVLVFDPEFNVGNYIEWDDGSGVIQSITLRVTRVESPNGGLVTIPNTVLTSQTITRPYGRNRYRVVDRIDIAYEDDVDEALDLLREAATEELDDVLADPTPTAVVEELGGAVVLRVQYWIDDPRWNEITRVRSRFARAAKERLEAADIAISPASKRELEGRIAVDGTDSGDATGQ